jgi:glycosyltransferase involved in cell wall biosynthesis
VVHSHLVQSDAACLLFLNATKKITTIHISKFDSDDGIVSKLLNRFVARWSHKFEARIACSDASRIFMEETKYAHPIVGIDNGVEVPRADSDSFLWSPEKRYRFVHIGRNHPVKDHPTLFRAVALARKKGFPVTIDCFGSGVDDQDLGLRNLLTALNIENAVALKGASESIVERLSDYSAVVISSRYEALPMAGMEALSIGLPVISTDVGNCGELVSDPSWLSSVGDAERLAGNICRIASMDADDWGSLSAESRQLAERKFDVLNTARAYDALVDSLCRLP